MLNDFIIAVYPHLNYHSQACLVIEPQVQQERTL